MVRRPVEIGAWMAKRVLFITSTRIGDAVLSSGVLAHLVETEPEAHFTVACGPLVQDLFSNVPRLERIHAMTKSKRSGHWFKLWQSTARTKWHRVVDLRSSGLSYVLRARHRHVSKKSDLHRVEAASRVLGLPQAAAPHIFHSHDELAKVSAELAGAPILAIGATANWVGKRWPIDRYAELIKRLTARGEPFEGARILLVGAPDEREMIAPLLDTLPAGQLIDRVGALNLMEVFLHLKCADFFIGNDSGLMHLAAAAAIPTLGLFGPTNEEWYRPWGTSTATVRGPASYRDILATPGYDWRLDKSYMLDLDVDTVETAVHELTDRIIG